MSHPAMTRAHLEALLVGHVAVRHDWAPTVLARVDRDRLSPAAWALLEQIARPIPDGGARPGDVRTATEGQTRLADRVEAVMLGDLFLWPLETVLGLVNQLPARPVRTPAWERDLERAAS